MWVGHYKYQLILTYLWVGTFLDQLFFQEYFDYVRSLWRDAGVKECFKRSNEYQLIDSAE